MKISYVTSALQENGIFLLNLLLKLTSETKFLRADNIVVAFGGADHTTRINAPSVWLSWCKFNHLSK